LKYLINELRVSLVATLLLALILCAFYPLVVWMLAQGLFPGKANGSLVESDGKILGSSLLGQNFTGPKYFHPRPSSAGSGYDASASGGSNLGPLSKKLADSVAKRVSAYRAENGLSREVLVPADAVTSSGSGLDPHISPRNALLQAPRVARARGLSEETVLSAVRVHTEGRELGVFGEARVNVLELNLALDGRGK